MTADSAVELRLVVTEIDRFVVALQRLSGAGPSRLRSGTELGIYDSDDLVIESQSDRATIPADEIPRVRSLDLHPESR